MDVIEKMLARPEFRGLWRSRTMWEHGKIEVGWSVTFVLNGDYCEVPYQDTAYEACRQALDRIAGE